MTFLSVKYTQMTINLYLANNLDILLSPYICGLLNIDINVTILFVFVIIILSDNCFGILSRLSMYSTLETITKELSIIFALISIISTFNTDVFLEGFLRLSAPITKSIVFTLDMVATLSRSSGVIATIAIFMLMLYQMLGNSLKVSSCVKEDINWIIDRLNASVRDINSFPLLSSLLVKLFFFRKRFNWTDNNSCHMIFIGFTYVMSCLLNIKQEDNWNIKQYFNFTELIRTSIYYYPSILQGKRSYYYHVNNNLKISQSFSNINSLSSCKFICIIARV